MFGIGCDFSAEGSEGGDGLGNLLLQSRMVLMVYIFRVSAKEIGRFGRHVAKKVEWSVMSQFNTGFRYYNNIQHDTLLITRL